MLKQANELPETMVKVGAENEEYADHQSENPTMETMFTGHTISEGLVIMVSSTESSNDVEEPEKIPESHNVENSKIKEGRKTMVEEAIYIKEATDVESPKSKTKSNYVLKFWHSALKILFPPPPKPKNRKKKQAWYFIKQ